LHGIADAVEHLTPGAAGVEMIGAGIDKTLKGVKQFGEIGYVTQPDMKSVVMKSINATLNTTVGVGETVLGTLMTATPEGAIGFMPFDYATKYLPQEVSEKLMPITYLVNEYYDGKPPEWAQNLGFIGDIATFALLHGAYNKAKKYKSLKDFSEAEFDPKDVEAAIKAAEEKVIKYGENTQEYQDAVILDVQEIVEGGKELIETIDTKEVEVPQEPKPVPTTLGELSEGSTVEYKGEKGTIERGDDGTWYFEVWDESRPPEQIPVKDKTNAVELLKDLGIDLLPDVTDAELARAAADAEIVGEVEYRGKKYFVSLGNPKIEGSYDFVLERTNDGNLVNRFDNHADPNFARDRKLAITNAFLEGEGLPRRDSNMNMPKTDAKPIEADATMAEEVQEKVQEEVPKVEEVKVEAPKVEVVEQPKAEAPKVEEAPKTEPTKFEGKERELLDAEKPTETKIEMVSNKELANSKSPTEYKLRHDKLKIDYVNLIKLIKCL
jgi:hypothetical protein